MAVKSTVETRLNRDGWLQHALEVLRDEGIQGVRIGRMARDLGVTKGSFYWHFKDLHDLHQSMLEHWAEKYSDVVSENREYFNRDAIGGLLAAMSRVREDRLDAFEVAMRSWADHDPVADAVVRAVYERRTKFVRSFFTRLGFNGADADVRTHTTLCYMSWEPAMYATDSDRRRLNLLKLHLELVTRK